MMHGRSLGYVLLTLLVVMGLTVPVTAMSTVDGVQATDGNTEPVAAAAAQENTTENDSDVNVTVGQQLSTVLSVSSDEIQSDFENTAFEVSIEGREEEAKAEAIAERAEELRDGAEDIREDYDDATEAYEDGEISKSEFAQRLATLNARGKNLVNSYDQLRERANNVSALELRAAGVNQSALRAAVENLSSVNGTGSAALLSQFTGEAEGKIELETANGLSIEIKSDDGEQSREYERPQDADRNITVNQSAALETARAALSTPENGTWALTKAKVKQDEGVYEFEFELRGGSDDTGEAEVQVDGSSGEVFALEEEIEPRDEDDVEDSEEDDSEDGEEDDADAEDENDEELAMIVSDGTPSPNATVTVTVFSNGEAAANVTVFLNGDAVGTTDSAGMVTVTLPKSGEAKLEAEKGEAEGELEFEFEDEEDGEDEEDEVFRNLNVTVSLAEETVSVSVSYNGSGVDNATVYANGQAVGTTSPDGTTSFTFDTNATDELEVEVVKGAFEAELEYEVQNGSLTLIEEAHEGDGDKVESDEAESEDERDDEETDEESDDAESEDESEDEETDEESDDGESGEESGEESDDGETEDESADEETDEESDDAETDEESGDESDDEETDDDS